MDNFQTIITANVTLQGVFESHYVLSNNQNHITSLDLSRNTHGTRQYSANQWTEVKTQLALGRWPSRGTCQLLLVFIKLII